MTNTIRIIETDTIQAGDFVAYMDGTEERAGVSRGFNEAGGIDVFLACGDVVSVAHEDVTDILAMNA